MDETADVLIVGAGLAGLSCARTLGEAGLSVRVLDRSRVVGGRCATKSDPSPVDFGPIFVHGDDPDFLSWVRSTGEPLVAGWPRVVRGTGLPCQPQAFDPLQTRFAVPGGLRRLSEALARGLAVELASPVEQLEWHDQGVTAVTPSGRFSGRHGVVATAFEESRALLATLTEGPALPVVRRADALLSSFSSLPCLTVLAEYPEAVPSPPWDVWYPEDSPGLLVVSNEGSKRSLGPGRGPSLVFQARPGWSAERLEADAETWSRDILGAAADLLGPWAAHPAAFRSHRWRYGRLGAADHLVRPMLLDRPGSTALWGLAGDLFDVDGGLQGAWRSGRALGLRLAEVVGSRR